MRNFKFFNTIDENDAIEPIGQYQTEPPQIYTQMLQMNVPMAEMTEDYMREIKIRQERVLINNLMETFDFRHEIIYQDQNGFSLRTELFL